MKFLVDAQLPRELAAWLNKQNHDAVHTSHLPKGNRTTDSEILQLSDEERRIVITKDRDFIDSFLIRRQPNRLLLVATGNITNKALLKLFRDSLPELVRCFEANHCVELTTDRLLIRD